jgi:hypothetical protein
MAGTLELPEAGEKNEKADPKIRALLKEFNDLLDGSNKIPGTSLAAAAAITAAQLAPSAKPFTWYTPKIINTEESRTNVAFGTLTTADEIASVVLPENGLILVNYAALWKESVSGAARAALFLGENQVKIPKVAATSPAVQETNATGRNWTGTVADTVNTFRHLFSNEAGLNSYPTTAAATNVTTGQIAGALAEDGNAAHGGFVALFAAAGTYTVSVRFKASSGSVTAKERKLWIATLG